MWLGMRVSRVWCQVPPEHTSGCVGSWPGIILFKIKRFKFQHFANYSFLLMAPCLISKYAKALSDLIMLLRNTLVGGLSLPFSMHSWLLFSSNNNGFQLFWLSLKSIPIVGVTLCNTSAVMQFAVQCNLIARLCHLSLPALSDLCPDCQIVTPEANWEIKVPRWSPPSPHWPPGPLSTFPCLPERVKHFIMLTSAQIQNLWRLHNHNPEQAS